MHIHVHIFLEHQSSISSNCFTVSGRALPCSSKRASRAFSRAHSAFSSERRSRTSSSFSLSFLLFIFSLSSSSSCLLFIFFFSSSCCCHAARCSACSSCEQWGTPRRSAMHTKQHCALMQLQNMAMSRNGYGTQYKFPAVQGNDLLCRCFVVFNFQNFQALQHVQYFQTFSHFNNCKTSQLFKTFKPFNCLKLFNMFKMFKRCKSYTTLQLFNF